MKTDELREWLMRVVTLLVKKTWHGFMAVLSTVWVATRFTARVTGVAAWWVLRVVARGFVLAWYAARYCLSPRYRDRLAEEKAYAAWTSMSPSARKAADTNLAVLRGAGFVVDDQGVQVIEVGWWASDVWTQGALVAMCDCHPDLAKAAKAALKDAGTLGRPKPDAVENMRALWRAAWQYRREAQEAAQAEARREERAKVTPHERFESSWKIGLYSGVTVIVIALLYFYTVPTLLALVLAVPLAVINLIRKATASNTPKEERDERDEQRGRGGPVRVLPAGRRSVRGL